MKYIYPQKNNFQFITQAFTTKEAGNLSFSRETDSRYAFERYERIAKDFGILPERMVMLKQVHGTDVFVAESGHLSYERPVSDAVITNIPGIGIFTVHADCVPVYFADITGKSIGLAHSGWKGTLGGVSLKTLEMMKRYYGTRYEDVYVTIGPHICMNCFEVRNDVYSLFAEKYTGYGKYITEKNIDLAGIIEKCLIEEGVIKENIYNMAMCTCCNPDLFFSHRRSTKSNIQDEGAMAAFAFLKG